MKIYFVGNVSIEKGIQDFYRLSKDIEAEFYWFSYGVSEFDVAKYPSINFIKEQNDAKFISKVREMDLFVSFSRYEGFCLPIAEALLNGKPVISYNLPELKSVYGNHINLVDYGDYEALKSKVLDCLLNYSFYLDSAKISKKFIEENYSPKNVISTLMNILQNEK